MLTAGTARKDINPPLSIPHVGWGAQTHIEGIGIEADLWTTVAVIGDERATAILIDVDTSHFSMAQADEIRRRVAENTGIDATRIRVSTTHTHSGPMLLSEYYPQHREIIESYFETICSQTAEAAKEAMARRIAVHISAGSGSCRIGKNRRQALDGGRLVVGYNPDGPTDPTVAVVRFDDAEGHAVLSLVHYACHPTMLGFDNRLHSPEYPGVTKRVVESLVGGVCLFLQGAAGNVGPGPEGFLTNLNAMKRIGTTLGCEAAKTLLELGEPEDAEYVFDRLVESGAPLGIWRKQAASRREPVVFDVRCAGVRLPLGRQLPIDEARETAEGQARELERLQRDGASEERIKEATFRAKRAYFALRRSELYGGESHIEIEAQCIRIGDMALVSVPLEIFVQIGIAVKNGSPFAHTLVSGYSNGWQGYLPTRADYPHGGYEVETTPFAPGADENLVEALTALLREMKAGD